MGSKNWIKTCEGCGRSFRAKHSQADYCSPDCRKQYVGSSTLWLRSYKIYERDDFRCAYCGRSSIEDSLTLSIDHIVPQCQGGSNEISNLITSCRVCNSSKNGRLLPPKTVKRLLKGFSQNAKIKELPI